MSASVPRCISVPCRVAALTLGLQLLGGCASTQLGAQYVNPQFPRHALRGAAVLVVCEAPEPALKLLCESQISGQLLPLGVRPMTDSSLANPTPGREPPPGQYRPAALAVGARAIFSATLTPDYAVANPPPWVSIGVGGWGGSGGYYGGSGGGVGVGVTMPVGTGQSVPGLAAIGSITDASSGSVMWTAKATTPPTNNASNQVVEVIKALTGAAQQAELF